MSERYDPRIADAWRQQLTKTKDELYAVISNQADEIARLRRQLAAEQQASTMLSLMVKERDAQLAVAREGLGKMLAILDKITAAMTQGVTDAYYEADTIKKLDECYEPSHAAIEQAEDLIRDTLAKVDQMEKP